MPSAPQANAVPAAPPVQSADPFPATNKKFFTASSPSLETVNGFLKALWGYDTNRIWRVMAIQTTPAHDVAKVVVFVSEKTPNAKISSATFYTTPDGKHAIAEGAGVIPFAADPFADARAMMMARANGPWRGAAGKDLEMVEFADLQCPHCKEAQSTMDSLQKDFPDAHIVFQLFPLVDIHPSAFKAATYAACVAKLDGNDAFFKYTAAVFDTQDELSSTTDDTVLKAAATHAELDPAKIAACAATPQAKQTVDADIQLANDAGVDQTPLLFVNGRMLPITSMPYEQLKQIIVYQAQMDHVPTGAAADVVTRPEPPKLSDLPK
jgi:protein-disulfide isomerase